MAAKKKKLNFIRRAIAGLGLRIFQTASGISGDPNDERFWTPFGFTGKTVAGEAVSGVTALGVAAYWACMRLVSSSIAKIPICMYRELDDGSKLIERDHPLYPILRFAANSETTAYRFVQIMTAWSMGYGNAYAQIVRDGRGRIVAMWQIHPSRVRVLRDPDTMELFYEVRGQPGQVPGSGATTTLRSSQMLHLRGPTRDGVMGMSVLEYNAEIIGAAQAGMKFASAFFGNGITLSGVIEHPETLDEDGAKALSQSWHSAFGGAANANGVVVLEEGAKWHQMGIPPDQAQFLETRQFHVEEICRLWGVPPHKIQHLIGATFNTLEQQNLEFVGDCLEPWLISWAQEIKMRLLDPTEDIDVMVEHDLTALMRTDHIARANYFRAMGTLGVYSPNDIRVKLGEPRITDPAADNYYIQGAMVPLQSAANSDWNTSGKGANPNAQDNQQGQNEEADDSGNDTQTETDQPNGESDSQKRVARSAMVLFTDALERVVRRQVHAVADAAKRHKDQAAFNAWLRTFYRSEPSVAYKALAPTLAALEAKPEAVEAVRSHLVSWCDQIQAGIANAFVEGSAVGFVESVLTNQPAAVSQNLVRFLTEKTNAVHAQ